MMKGCWKMVFQQQKEVKQVLDGVVSSMMEGEKEDGKGMKNAEQWCFSIGETDEKLLRMVLQQRKGKKVKQVLDGVFRE